MNNTPTRLFIAIAIPMLHIAPGSRALAQAREAATPRLTAIVTDSKGAATEVVDLRARYWDERQGQNRLESVELPSIVVQVETQEGRVTATDEVTIRFGDIRRITFPGNFRVDIERRNGGTLILDQIRAPNWTRDQQRSLQERDPHGAVTNDLKFHDYTIAMLKQDGMVLGTKVMRPMVLGAFVGRARMAAGREGAFSIFANEVKTIEFK